jgi:DNA repair protein RAD5
MDPQARRKSIQQKLPQYKTLIIVPLSLISQWQLELTSHSTPHSLTIFQYYGENRDNSDLSSYDVVITTYNVLQVEKNKNGILFRGKWFRVILDEAHTIKSHLTAQAKACVEL